MKRLFRFTPYGRDAGGRLETGGLAGGSPTEDTLSDPAAPGGARPVFQTLSTIHPASLSDSAMRAVGVDGSSLSAPGGAGLSVTESGTSRGGPPGQAGLGDPDLPLSRLLLAYALRPLRPVFPRGTTTVISYGFDEHIDKPFEPPPLYAMLNTALSKDDKRPAA